MKTMAWIAALLFPWAAHAAPVLFHAHGHGLSFSADGAALLAPSEQGLAVYEDAAWHEPESANGGFSGFSASERALYSSGHPQPGRAARGLLRSMDGARTWQPLALQGEADFPLIAAGFRSGMLYMLHADGSATLPQPGIYATTDEGKSWRRAQTRGLAGEIHGLAAHPVEPAVLAVASASGLYLSRDGGESFRRLDRRGPVTAVAFDLDGKRLRYARALSSEIIESALDGRERRIFGLPRREGDYVTCLAQNPKDERAFAFATRRRDVYLTTDGGAHWQRIWNSSKESEQ